MKMAQINGHIEVTLRARRRRGFGVALQGLTVACAVASLFSERLAHWISSVGTTLIARYGIKVSAG